MLLGHVRRAGRGSGRSGPVRERARWQDGGVRPMLASRSGWMRTPGRVAAGASAPASVGQAPPWICRIRERPLDISFTYGTVGFGKYGGPLYPSLA